MGKDRSASDGTRTGRVEHHDFYFQGVWVPADIFTMVASGKINAVDVFILLVVEAHVGPDRGCTESDASIAKQAGVVTMMASQSLSRLGQVGLLTMREFKGVRELETVWSRVGNGS